MSEEVPSEHEHATEEREGVPDRGEVESRSERRGHVSGDADADAARRAADDDGVDQPRFAEADSPLDDPRILALIQSSQHLHLPVQLPEAAALADLKRADPRAYDVWLTAVENRISHDMWMERAPMMLPFRIARLGQWFGLIGLLVMAGLTVVAILYGNAWLAGLFGVLDFVGVVAAFTQNGSDSDKD